MLSEHCIPAGFIYSIIVLVTDKTNKLPRFHAVQSLLWSAVIFVLVVILEIFAVVAAIVIGSAAIASLLGLLVWVVVVGLLAFGIFAGYKGYQGEAFKLPAIGDMADKWSN